MNSKKVLSMTLAIALSTSGSAFAQYTGHRSDDRMQNRTSQHDGDRRDRRDGRGDASRMDHRNQGRADRFDTRQHWRGPDPTRQFHRGDRLPPEYRHRQYVVDDWRGHRLSAPPRGYHWVQRGGDYILVAIATGVILQILQNH